MTLCGCGCGQEVKQGRAFISGHNNCKTPWTPIPEPTLCECGCGEYATPGRQFIRGHYTRLHNPMKNPEIAKKTRKVLDASPICKLCGEVLTDVNWRPSDKTKRNCICKTCENERDKQIYIDHHDKKLEWMRLRRRANGGLSMAENKECASYLGIHITENVVYHIFKNITRMPYNNPGYDFICGIGYLIDSKSSCMYIRPGKSPIWNFRINRNKIADYFVLVAFDNRDDLELKHVWMIPGNIINNNVSVSISTTTIDKWNKYSIDMGKALACCDAMKDGNV